VERSGEVCIFRHRPGAASIAEVGGAATPSTSAAAALSAAHVSDNSTDEDSEKCPICLVTFAEQEIGTPEYCEHIFCVGCLEEWSKYGNTCPIDRQVFNVIFVRLNSDRSIIREIPVRPRLRWTAQTRWRPRRRWRPRHRRRIVLQGEPSCEVCGQSDREDRMITCNGCRLVYHVECLISLLHVLPVVDWSCSSCIMLSSMLYRDYALRRGGRM
jgi:PHD and RING finger domain-containing protein 1